MSDNKETKQSAKSVDLGMMYLKPSTCKDIVTWVSGMYMDASALSVRAMADRDHSILLDPETLREMIQQTRAQAARAEEVARCLERVKADVELFRETVEERTRRVLQRGFFGLQFPDESHDQFLELKGPPLCTKDRHFFLGKVYMAKQHVGSHSLDEGRTKLSSYVPIPIFSYHEVSTGEKDHVEHVLADSVEELQAKMLEKFPKVVMSQTSNELEELVYDITPLIRDLIRIVSSYLKYTINGKEAWDVAPRFLITNRDEDLVLQKRLVDEALVDHVGSFSEFTGRYHIRFLHPKTEAYFNEQVEAKRASVAIERIAESQAAKRIRRL